MMSASTSGLSNNKTLIVILSSVLSVVAVLVVAGVVFLCCRHRQRGKGLFPRGISPIDDDEIETWKGHNPSGMDEKEKSVFSNDTDSPPLLPGSTLGATVHQPEGPPPVRPPASRARGVSLDSASAPFSASMSRPMPPGRTLSNVIVYKEPPTAASSTPTLHRPHSSGTGPSPVAATPAGVAAIHHLQQQQQSMPALRRSEEISPRSARSLSFGYSSGRAVVGRSSSDQDRDPSFSVPTLSPLTPAALQHACAPNSRAGLTDEAVPGDPSFLPTLKRQSSRRMKMPPAVGAAAAAAAGMSAPATAYAPRRKSSSARSASTVGGRSHSGSDAGPVQPLGTSHQRRSSQAQMQYFGRSQPPPVSAYGSHASLHRAMPAPPPVSARAGVASHSRQASQSRVGSDSDFTSHRSNSSIYRGYTSLEHAQIGRAIG